MKKLFFLTFVILFTTNGVFAQNDATMQEAYDFAEKKLEEYGRSKVKREPKGFHTLKTKGYYLYTKMDFEKNILKIEVQIIKTFIDGGFKSEVETYEINLSKVEKIYKEDLPSKEIIYLGTFYPIGIITEGKYIDEHWEKYHYNADDDKIYDLDKKYITDNIIIYITNSEIRSRIIKALEHMVKLAKADTEHREKF